MDLEDELKRLFQDQRLDVRVSEDAEKTVVAGARRVRRNRIAAIGTAGALGAAVVVAGTLVLAGGNPESVGVATEPPPLTIISTEPSPTSAPSTTTKPEPSQVGTPAEPTKPTRMPPGVLAELGPDGLGDLQLGMSYEKAAGTGQIEGRLAGTSCAVIQVKGMPDTSTVTFSKTHGLVAIHLTGDARTASGIGMGATEKQVRQQHPDLLVPTTGEATAPTGGRTKATYGFTFTRGVVSRISLIAATGEECVR